MVLYLPFLLTARVGVPVGEFLKSFDEVGWIPQFQSRFLAELLSSSPDSSIPVPISQFQSQFLNSSPNFSIPVPIPVSILGGGWSSLSGVVCVGPLLVASLLVGIVPLILS